METDRGQVITLAYLRKVCCDVGGIWREEHLSSTQVPRVWILSAFFVLVLLD